jgi:3'-5' exoribonuclease
MSPAHGPAIRDLAEGESIESAYAVREASLQTTSQGKFYIRMTLADATGEVTANVWDASPEQFASFGAGDVLRVRGAVETYRGRTQLKVTAFRTLAAEEVDPARFLPVTTADVDGLLAELDRVVASVRDGACRALLESVFGEPRVRDGFARSPAAMKNHHAWIGGLLEHTLNLVHLAEAFCDAGSTRLDRDLLLTGTLLHDIGKTEELSAAATIDYTDAGRLVGHLILGTVLVERHARALPEFPEETLRLVQHMILSHHGRYEYGSPVLPKTPEAIALHHIDNLDAKTVAARRCIDEDPNPDRRWTDRSWMLETQLYKHPLPDPDPASDREAPGGSADPTSAGPGRAPRAADAARDTSDQDTLPF